MRSALLLCVLVAACRSTAADPEGHLVPLLRDGDRGVRYAAVLGLGKAGVGEAALAEAQRDPEWCVRAEAAVALARIGPRALPFVLEAARDQDREVRLESWTALRRMGPGAVRAGRAALRAGLASADLEERLEAARCLVLLGEDEHARLMPALLAGLDAETEPDLVSRAAWILRALGPHGAAARPAVERLLRDDRFKTCNALGAALASMRLYVRPVEPHLTETQARERLGSSGIGDVLDGALALEALGIDPRPLLAQRDDANAARVFLILGAGGTMPPERWVYSDDESVAEAAELASGQRSVPPTVRVTAGPCLRAAEIWASGRAGLPQAEYLKDENALVREVAVRTLGPPELASALIDRNLDLRRLAANRCAEARIFTPELLSAARSEDHDLRLLATRALSRTGHPFLPALRDASRAVRLEAVLGLSAGYEAHLLTALDDPEWRVRRAALQRLGRSEAAAKAAASLLGDTNPLLSEAAADALARMGESAALPLAAALPCANAAVQYHAPRVLEALGAQGAAATPTLVRLLADADVNVREHAARCLAAIGPAARTAAPALVRALGDARLCVVSRAALALGALGLTPELSCALRDPRARVRAYAAFAYGWACGAARGLDQVPFEVRLPVLDCGDAPPGRFMELRSKDATVAIPCAAAREAEELDAWECERVLELLLCGGCRPDAPGDFDDRFRSILGSAELPAAISYTVRARRTRPSKRSFFGENHRIARRENIPALLWFRRTEDDDALDGIEEVYQPVHAVHDPGLFVEEGGGRGGPGLPPALRAWLRGEGDLWIPNGLRWLNDVDPLESDAPDLLAFSGWAFGPDGDAYARCAAVRALGKIRDAASERLLRDVSVRDWPKGHPYLDERLPRLARGALARRGLPDAMAALLEDGDFAVLLESVPGFAVARLRERLLDPETVHGTCDLLPEVLDDTFLGIRFEETLFAGIAEAAIASRLDGYALARIAVAVPGCRRRDVAEAAVARLDPKAWIRDEGGQPDFEAAAFLHSADPERFVALLRSWSDDADEGTRGVALAMLLRIGDPASADKLIGTEDCELLPRTRAPAVERFLRARAEAGDEDAIRALGESVPEMLRALEADGDRNLEPELGLTKDPRVLAWLRAQRQTRKYDYARVLSALVLAGDRDAREELWSMVRCGRHRLLYGGFEERVFTLDWDLSTLPHWIEELDSNCCRVAGGLEGIFQDYLGMRWLYDRPGSGLGEPRSRRVRTELLWSGGHYVWSPLVDRFVALPE